MASLTAPLKVGGQGSSIRVVTGFVSIKEWPFALKTALHRNTDYLLVPQVMLSDAIRVLERDGIFS